MKTNLDAEVTRLIDRIASPNLSGKAKVWNSGERLKSGGAHYSPAKLRMLRMMRALPGDEFRSGVLARRLKIATHTATEQLRGLREMGLVEDDGQYRACSLCGHVKSGERLWKLTTLGEKFVVRIDELGIA